MCLRLNVVKIVDIITVPGMKMMYTSGCPNHQKRCWYTSTSPPTEGLKNCVLQVRSSNSMVLDSTTPGSAKMTMKATTTWPHTNKGMRFSDMPGARRRNTVTTVSTATASADTSVNVISCAQKSGRFPGP